MIRSSSRMVVALCAALVLAACGGGGGTPAPSGAGGAPVPGGTARVLVYSEARSMDPATLGNAWARHAFLGNALYGTLLIDDRATRKERPMMAESFTSGDGGATFTLKLRPGLTFSDGSALDAAAVKFNWDRQKDPASGTQYRAEVSMIASTAVADPTTLAVTMVEPVPNYASVVTTSSLNWIASPAALQAGQQAFDAKPIGAGPYTLQSWVRGGAVELVRNPRYWDAPKPYLDRITVTTSSDAAQRYNSVISGGIDVAVESSWVNLAKAKQAGFPTDRVELNGGQYLAMNTRRAPFDDVRARQAVAAALDPNAANQATYRGEAQLVSTLFREGSPYYADTALRTPDKDRAQRLFDELAAEGKPVSFTFTSFPTSESRSIAESVQAQLAAFRNTKVEIKIVDLAETGALHASHDFDVMISSAFFRDPDPRLYNVFHGGSDSNMAGIDDAELNAALETGRTATAPQDRRAAYATVQRRLVELMPVLFDFQAAPGAVTGKRVRGLMQYGDGSLLPEELWIQK